MVKKYGRRQTNRLTILGLFVAILMIQSFVPGLGYIPIGPLNATIVQVTVIVAGVFFGVRMGAISGCVWGSLSLIRSVLMPTIMTPVLLNPFVSILPRFLVGLIAAYLFKSLSKQFPLFLRGAIVGAVGSLLNTLFFLTAVYFFAADSYAQALGVDTTALLNLLVAVVVSNGLPEALVSGMLTPMIILPLYKRITQRLVF